MSDNREKSLRVQGKEPDPKYAVGVAAATRKRKGTESTAACSASELAASGSTSREGREKEFGTPSRTPSSCVGSPSEAVQGRDSGSLEETNPSYFETDLDTLVEEAREGEFTRRTKSSLITPAPRIDSQVTPVDEKSTTAGIGKPAQTSSSSEKALPLAEKEESLEKSPSRSLFKSALQWLKPGARTSQAEQATQSEGAGSGTRNTRSTETTLGHNDDIDDFTWDKAVTAAENVIAEARGDKRLASATNTPVRVFSAPCIPAGTASTPVQRVSSVIELTSSSDESCSSDMANDASLTTKPPTFYGKDGEDALAWVDRYEKIAKFNKWTQQEMKDNFVIFLDGSALKWFLCRETDDKIPPRWSVPAAADVAQDSDSEEEEEDLTKIGLKELFLKQFTPIGYERYFEHKLRNRRQSPDENLTEYFYDVLNICRLVDKNMAEKMKVHHLLKGLRPNLREKLWPLRPKKCSDFLRGAQDFLSVAADSSSQSQDIVASSISATSTSASFNENHTERLLSHIEECMENMLTNMFEKYKNDIESDNDYESDDDS